MSAAPAAEPRRDDYGFGLSIATRWRDQDLYGHVNNVVYYSYFDTVINTYLIEVGGLDAAAGPVIGVCAESQCQFRRALNFPETIEARLRVARLGETSVTYDIALFKQDSEAAAASGHFVHVFVNRQTMRPAPIPTPIRAALRRLEATGAD